MQIRQGTKISFSCSNGGWVPLMRAEVQFMRAAKNLTNLHICIESPERSPLENVITSQKYRAGNLHAIYARSEGSVESARLSLQHSTSTIRHIYKIPCAGSNGDLSATYAASQYTWRVTTAQSEPLKQYLNLMCWLRW